MTTSKIAIDFGTSNIKLAWRVRDEEPHLLTLPRESPARENVVDEAVLAKAISSTGLRPRSFTEIRVTGGQTHRLAGSFDGASVIKVSEVDAIGRGGLHLAQLDEALIVSAGSGTAMIAARAGGADAKHVTGSAVGGGTLQGLARLLIGTTHPQEIDALARQGDSNKVDLTLIEVMGGVIGSLPADANAVNFGKLSRASLDVKPTHADLAAGLVCLVGQVIAVIAINAARAEHLAHIVVIGHLANLPSVCKVLNTVAGYYDASLQIAPTPGYGTVLGALL